MTPHRFHLGQSLARARQITEAIVQLQTHYADIQEELSARRVRVAGPSTLPQEFEMIWDLKTLDDLNLAIAGRGRLSVEETLKAMTLAGRNGYVTLQDEPTQPEKSLVEQTRVLFATRLCTRAPEIA